MIDTTAIRLEGALFGPDILEQLRSGELSGQRPEDFGLDGRRSITNEVAQVFEQARELWRSFRERQARQTADSDTTLTRRAWVLPFLALLDYELVPVRRGEVVDGRTFRVSHHIDADEGPPVHVVGSQQSLDRVDPNGVPRLAPHSLLQQYLNGTEHTWGIVTNGRQLRILRDSTWLRRQSFVEFDLEAILEGNRFDDFEVVFRLLHRSRLPKGPGDSCLLEDYHRAGEEQGGRVRERLRDGVERAIERLANGFLSRQENSELRERLAQRESSEAAAIFYRELLRTVYRFLFLLVAEDRGLVSDSPLFRDHYGVGRLRRLAERRAAYTDDVDVWRSLCVLWEVLRNPEYAPMLGTAPLDGELFSPPERSADSVDLAEYEIANRDLLAAFRELAWYEDERGVRQRVNFRALDVEELGSVYESLLDYRPSLDFSGSVPVFRLAYGMERKSTGSYYTPHSLVQELIKSALDPVIEERLAARRSAQEQERALLSIRVVDPACGSGHFLLAAARRLAEALARVRSGSDEPSPEEVRHAKREVIAHCIYGVDKNPLAVELCRVALWIESHEPGKPLTFLDHHIRCGDSLVGVFDLQALRRGIPDEAFDAKTGDDKAAAQEAKRRNKEARERPQLVLPLGQEQADPPDLEELAWEALEIESLPEETVGQRDEKRRRWEQFVRSLDRARLACDLWTAAFFQRFERAREAIATGHVLNVLAGRQLPPQVEAEAVRLAQEHRFFHWPLEFPEAFADGGFDVVLGNPPWERIKLQEQEFFAARDLAIARASNAAARRRLIEELKTRNPALWHEYIAALTASEAGSQFLRKSGRFPLAGRGDINTYAVFAELARSLAAPRGAAGIIVPTGIATDDTTKQFFSDLIQRRQLASLFDFENRKKLFPAVDSRMKFCTLTFTGAGRPAREAEFAFFLHDVADLRDEERRFTLTPEDFALLNPNTGTAPIFRTRRDAELTRHIYRRVPVLVDERRGGSGNLWDVGFLRMFDMSNDSGLFRTREELERQGYRLQGNVFVRGGERFLPLYEAKMVHQFDHRWATYDGTKKSGAPDTRDVTDAEKADPDFVVLPRYWVDEREVEARLRAKGWERGWLLGWRDITNATNERTVIASVIPRVAVGNKIPLVLNANRPIPDTLLASLGSMALDFTARQKVGGTTLNFFLFQQFPVLPPEAFDRPCPWAPGETLADWIRRRVLELTYTARDLEPFARDLGYDGPPFAWDPHRRALVRAELDAAFFLLYLGTEEEWQAEASAELKTLFPTARSAVEYILDQFPVLRNNEERRYGEFRTRRLVLEAYDRLAGGHP